MRKFTMKMPQTKSSRTPRRRLCASLRSRNEHFLPTMLGGTKSFGPDKATNSLDLPQFSKSWMFHLLARYSMYNNPQKDRILILKHVSQRVVNSPQSIILVFFLPLCEVLPNIILFVNVCSISLPSYHLLIVT
jgi:hypothetical protein